jgi:beta-glucanase (GH16 family)
MNKLTAIIALLIFAGLSCNKPDNTEEEIVPTNLTLTADISTDNSGSVLFVATATNATSYAFDFGNGITEVAYTGTVTYHYITSGSYTVTVVARSSNGKTASKSIEINVTVVQGIVWSDDFDSPGPPNSAKWGYDIGANNGWGNNEKQYYTDRTDNAVVEGGFLKIILKKENYQGSAYTSARLLTKGKFSFKYGKIEIRAKLPAGGGTWPAIWMLGDNLSTAGWPACGEIDIMEHTGNLLNKIYSTLHYGPSVAGHLQSGGNKVISNATTEFHVYKAEWTPGTIKFFVDDAPIYTFVNNSTLPFNQNFFIILNVAMGGNFVGTIDPNFTSGTMEIDYVRVYQ